MPTTASDASRKRSTAATTRRSAGGRVSSSARSACCSGSERSRSSSRSRRRRLAADDAPEADVAGGGVDRLPLARGRAVPEAVVRRAQVRAALDHAARNRLAGGVAPLVAGDARVLRDAARLLGLVWVTLREEVGRPLPHVPRHVVEAVAVRRERPDRGRTLKPVELQVLPRELALPGVRHRLAVGEVLVAPGERRALEAAAGRELPLGFGRQLLAGPLGMRLRVDSVRRVPLDRAVVYRAGRWGSSELLLRGVEYAPVPR